MYHVINRANGRLRIFDNKSDYKLFEQLLLKAKEETDMRIYGYVIMPNHWHLILSPKKDGDLGTFMHRLTNAHTRQVHVRTKTIGYGHLYQGRYKSFLVEDDKYLLTLIRYVERNPVRAKFTLRCEDWEWGSAWQRIHDTVLLQKLLAPIPAELPGSYNTWINAPEDEDTLSYLRLSVNKGVPYGSTSWVDAMTEKYNLETTHRSVGRPRKS